MNKARLAMFALGAVAFFSPAALQAGNYGWITEIENQSKYPVVIQSTDNGMNNELMVPGDCDTGKQRSTLQIGCTPYVLLPAPYGKIGAHLVIPYEVHKGIMKVQVRMVDSNNDPTPINYAIQEQSGSVVITKESNPHNKFARSGETNYKLTIGLDKNVILERIAK